MIEGRHVKLLGHGCDPAKLGNVDHVKATIAGLVEACGMRALGLHAYDVEIEIAKLHAEPFEDEGGVTVVGVLSTSHAAIHTWPARGFFVLDVYSCRDFNAKAITHLLFQAFAREPSPGHVGHTAEGAAANGAVDLHFRGMTLRRTDLSHALEMPADWRQVVAEFRA